MRRRNKKRFLLARIISSARTVPEKIKKEKTRIKLRRRGSFADSTWLSLALRPLLEWQPTRAIFGAPLVVAAIAGALSTPLTDPATTLLTKQPEVLAMSVNPAQTLTTADARYYFMPVATLTGISQEFRAGHPGMDLRAPLGSDVLAMEGGRVKEIFDAHVGYGRHVIVEHRNGVITLYAHLGKITVEEGEAVVGGEKIGEVGLTGWSTGPHLHFEVRQDGSAVNPRLYLRIAMAEEAHTEKSSDYGHSGNY